MMFTHFTMPLMLLAQVLSLDIGPTTATKWYLFLQNAISDLKGILLSYDGEGWTELSKLSLTEDFIDEFSEYVDWESVSYHQNLTEYIMKKYKHKVDWYWIYELNKSIPIDLKNDLDHYFRHHNYDYLKGAYKIRKMA